MAILITPDIFYRATSRFAVNEQSEPAGAPGEEAHIYNLYEEFSMPLRDIIEIGRLGLEGKLENVQEKMDGQFLAFTVVNGQLRFFTKMDLQGQAAKDKKLALKEIIEFNHIPKLFEKKELLNSESKFLFSLINVLTLINNKTYIK